MVAQMVEVLEDCAFKVATVAHFAWLLLLLAKLMAGGLGVNKFASSS